MQELILFITIFVIIYLFYLFFVILNKSKLQKFNESIYVKFLINTNKLDEKKINIKSLAHIIALSNAFIISLTLIITDIINNFILKMVLGFGVLIILSLMIYYIIGRILKERSEKNV
ncbi:MAG: hypothetical protein PHN42_04885 [Bacilli bacterium]|nr:hypothetical protein [Bacilli bacterium]